MTILDDLQELLGDDRPLDECLTTLAEGVAAFYHTLVKDGIAPQDAHEMTLGLIAAVCG